MAEQPNLSAMMGQAFADQMEQQEALEQQTRDTQRKFNADMEAARAEILKRFTNKGKKTEYPAAVQQIANAMMMQPRLIEPMAIFLQTLVKRIDNAVNDAIRETLGEQTPPAEPGP